jgi:DNA-directed RNA polymerase subunit M/transcription elongation factor TFIIS
MSSRTRASAARARGRGGRRGRGRGRRRPRTKDIVLTLDVDEPLEEREELMPEEPQFPDPRSEDSTSVPKLPPSEEVEREDDTEIAVTPVIDPDDIPELTNIFQPIDRIPLDDTSSTQLEAMFDNLPGLSASEIEKLKAVLDIDNDTVVKGTKRDLLYELMGTVASTSLDEEEAESKNITKVSFDTLIEEMKQDLTLDNFWELPPFARARELRAKSVNRFRSELMSLTGEIRCSRCKSTNTEIQSKQTRAGDEATAVFTICHDCNLTKPL